ncbi:MAG: phosphatase PAP2 family protein, partial [Nocardioides sp.]
MPYTAATAGQFSFDRSWFESINRLSRQTPWLHTPVRDFAEYGIVLFAALLLWSWWRARGTRDVAAMAVSLWAPIGVLVAVGLNQPIANAVREPRPYDVLNHVLVLVSRSSDFSFPSDHGTMAGAVAAGVFL